jgi:hypothetical protein
VVRARGGALNFNDNGLNVNDYNDDNRNNNVAASAALPSRNFCLPFSCIFAWRPKSRLLFLLNAFNPTAEHPPNLIKRLLKGYVFLLT